MSTAASIDFSHTHYDIKYVQIQNISTATAWTRVTPVQELKKNSRVPVTCKTVVFSFF